MVSERESITAKICAFARAWHSTYSRDRIYDDYLAFDFMGKEEYENIYDMISDGLVGSERLEKEEAEKANSILNKAGDFAQDVRNEFTKNGSDSEEM